MFGSRASVAERPPNADQNTQTPLICIIRIKNINFGGGDYAVDKSTEYFILSLSLINLRWISGAPRAPYLGSAPARD